MGFNLFFIPCLNLGIVYFLWDSVAFKQEIFMLTVLPIYYSTILRNICIEYILLDTLQLLLRLDSCAFRMDIIIYLNIFFIF
jgi:hypothetical protein